MDDWLPATTGLRLAAALAGLALAVLVERRRPFRGRSAGALRNDLHNLALWCSGAAIPQLLPFIAGVGVAELARHNGIGLLNLLSAPTAVEILVTIAVLDAATYGLHRLYHAWPPLWRLHRVHHSDEMLTATTGVRFHPGEVLISAIVRVPLVALLGASVTGIVVFEAALLAASQLQHANIRVPSALDAALRRFLVTPNFHRVHHSRQRTQADSNFGTVLTLWDRLFGSAHPDVEPERVVVGLPESGAASPRSLLGLLAMPFSRTRELRVHAPLENRL